MHNKIFGAYSCEIKIKATYLHPIHTGGCEQFQFFPQAGEAGRRLVRCEKLAGMGFENHDASSKAKPDGSFFQMGKHGLVAQMHAVEISYGKRNWSFRPERNTMANA